MSNKNEKYQPLIEGDKVSKAKTFSNRIPYDPYLLPPNFEYAEAHHLATRIAQPIEEGPTTIDEASGLPLENKLVPICCDLDDMNFLSPGYPMYFQFIKFCCLILVTVFLTSGIHNIYSFYHGNSCKDTDLSFVEGHKIGGPINKYDVCTNNYINKFSLANRDGDHTDIEKADIFNFFTIIVLILLMQFIRKIQKQTALICDERQITASDYTCRVAKIPKTFTDKQDIQEEIKKFFTTQGVPGTQLNIAKVSVCYDCSEKIAAQKKIKQLTIQRAKLEYKEKKGQPVKEEEINKIDDQIEHLHDKIAALNKRLSEHVGVANLFAGEAYVTFETQQELQKVLKHWNVGGFTSFGQQFKPNSIYKFKGSVLKVRQAPEPSDVNWENVGIPYSSKVGLRVLTNLISFALILLSCLFIYWVNSRKMTMLVELKNEKAATESMKLITSIKVQAITILASFAVVFVNQVLIYVVEFLTNHEKHSTQTDSNTYYSQKLTIAQFANTAVATFLVYQYFGNLAGPGGLTYAVFIYFVTNAVTQWGFSLFSPFFIYMRICKYLVLKQKEPQMTQEQLNQIYRYPAFDFPSKYANYAKTTLSACFFAPLIPLVVPIALFGLAIEYWIDKYMLLRKRSRGVSLGPDMSFDFVEFLEYSMVCFAVGNFLYNIYVTKFDIYTQTLTVLGFIIGVVNAFLPMDRINEYFFHGRDEITTDDKYSEKKHTFLEDYDRMNPATMQIAMEAFIKERKAQQV